MSQLEDMRLFAATLDTGSFTAAAERLGLSKQFISKRVMALEAQLGVRLLMRTTRHLRPTDLGRAYAEQARRRSCSRSTSWTRRLPAPAMRRAVACA